jgi:hypothetical protein
MSDFATGSPSMTMFAFLFLLMVDGVIFWNLHQKSRLMAWLWFVVLCLLLIGATAGSWWAVRVPYQELKEGLVK